MRYGFYNHIDFVDDTGFKQVVDKAIVLCLAGDGTYRAVDAVVEGVRFCIGSIAGISFRCWGL